jgi:hypothetical protein
LFAGVPDVRFVERRDGFAARANLFDEAGGGREGND